MSGVDFWGEAIPNWVAAGSTLGALIAASIAGYFASRAAHWTRQQAEASQSQVDLQTEQLALVKSEARAAKDETGRQRAMSERMERRAEEARLDAMVPSIFAEATLGSEGFDGASSLEFRRGSGDWQEVSDDFEVPRGDRIVFRMSVTIQFLNVSAVPARIDVVEHDGGEIHELRGLEGVLVEPGEPVYLPPKSIKLVFWQRSVSSFGLVDGEGIVRPELVLFRLEFWARDVGMNVRDTYRFSGAFGHFRPDGSRLLVGPSAKIWNDRVAAPVERVYEHLITADLGELGADALDA